MGLPRVNAEAPRRACLASAANGLCAAVAGVSRLEAPARPAAGPCASGRPFGPKPAQPRVSLIGSAGRAVAGRQGVVFGGTSAGRVFAAHDVAALMLL